MFELTFLGASGGPLEQGTCSVIIKPAKYDYLELIKSKTIQQELLMVDAGSGLSLLRDIIHNEQHDNHRYPPLDYYDDALDVLEYTSVPISRPFANLQGNAFGLAQKILGGCVNCAITHPHLDHLTGLVVNLPFYASCGLSKYIFGLNYTVQLLRTHIFNGVVWPELPFLNFHELHFDTEVNIPRSKYSLRAFPLNHGKIRGRENYLSTAFLITYDGLNSMLIFGDFESDTTSELDYNKRVWHHVAPLIANGLLCTIVLECSNSHALDELYGHLNPGYLISELKCLRQEYEKITTEQLGKLSIIVTHVKESLGEDMGEPRKVILSELRLLAQAEGLNVDFLVGVTGATLVVS